MSTQVPVVPVVAFSFDIKFTDRPGGDNVVVQFHLPIDMKLEDMKEHSSKVMEVINFEKLKYKHRELLREKQISETFIDRAKQDMRDKHAKLADVEERALEGHVNSGRKGPVKYSGAIGSEHQRASQDILSGRQVLDNAEARHKHLLIELELTEQKLGINSSADSC